MFSFTYAIDENDYYEFNKHQTYCSPANRKRLMISRFAWPVIFISCGLLLGTSLEYPVIAYVVYGAAAVAWLVFFKRMTDRRIKKNLVRLKKIGKLPYPPDVTIAFFDDYVHEQTSMSETKFDYSLIERVDTTADTVYIYLSALSASILPNRVFKDSAERDAFLTFLRAKLMAQAGVK